MEGYPHAFLEQEISLRFFFLKERLFVCIFSFKKSFLGRMESLPVTNQKTSSISLPFSGESSEHSLNLSLGALEGLWYITSFLKPNTTARHVGGWKWGLWFVWPQLHLLVLETYSNINLIQYKTTEPKHFLTDHKKATRLSPKWDLCDLLAGMSLTNIKPCHFSTSYFDPNQARVNDSTTFTPTTPCYYHPFYHIEL